MSQTTVRRPEGGFRFKAFKEKRQKIASRASQRHRRPRCDSPRARRDQKFSPIDFFLGHLCDLSLPQFPRYLSPSGGIEIKHSDRRIASDNLGVGSGPRACADALASLRCGFVAEYFDLRAGLPPHPVRVVES